MAEITKDNSWKKGFDVDAESFFKEDPKEDPKEDSKEDPKEDPKEETVNPETTEENDETANRNPVKQFIKKLLKPFARLFYAKSMNSIAKSVLKRAENSLKKAAPARHNFIMIAENPVSAVRVDSKSATLALQKQLEAYTDAAEELGLLAIIVAHDIKSLTLNYKEITFLEKEVMAYCSKVKEKYGYKEFTRTRVRGRLSKRVLKRAKRTYYKFLALE